MMSHSSINSYKLGINKLILHIIFKKHFQHFAFIMKSCQRLKEARMHTNVFLVCC